MTVDEMTRTMPHAEYRLWAVWHARRRQRDELEQKRAGGSDG